jgi:hypothetical protein
MVHIGEISFCDKIAFNIKSDDTKKSLLDHIEQKYALKIITRHFDKFEERLMSNINNNPYMLCARSNGNPYFLYLTKIDFVNYCIFIDKKIQQGYFFPRMIICNYHFDDELFSDTILDGEMVKSTKDKWVFLVNDLIVYKGRYLKDQNLVKRLNLVYAMFKNEFKPDMMNVSRFQVKKYFRYDEIEEFLEKHIPSLSYTCRGIYFKSLFLRFRDILVNFDDDLVKKVERNKYKHVKNFLTMDDQVEKQQMPTAPKTAQTANNIASGGSEMSEMVKQFSVRKTNQPDVYELFDDKGSYVDVACIPTMKISKYLRDMFSNKNLVDKCDVRFEYSSKFQKWLPIIQT